MLNLKLQFGLECLIAISSYPLSFAWIFDIICFNVDYHLSTYPKYPRYHSVNWDKPIVPTGSTFVIVNDLSIWKDILMKIIQYNQSCLIFYLIRAEKRLNITKGTMDFENWALLQTTFTTYSKLNKLTPSFHQKI